MTHRFVTASRLYRMFVLLGIVLAIAGSNSFFFTTAHAANDLPSGDTVLDVPSMAIGGFQVVGNRIIGPDGKPFVVKGVNVAGYQWDWDRNTLKDIDSIVNCWKFNLVRVNSFLFKTSKWTQYHVNDDLDAIIKAFTARKVVVMLEAHDRTGTYYQNSALVSLTNWHLGFAKKYKDNPYVWFNVMNEPGDSYLPEKTKWLNMHRTVIKAIRETAKANNIIVVDGAASGQDAGDRPLATVPPETSAILTYGKDILNFNNKTYSNIVFSLHVYDLWNVPESRFADFFDRVLAKNQALIVGEYGSAIDEGIQTMKATQAMFKTAVPRGIGRVVWHWDDGDENKLTTAKPWGGGYGISDCYNPTNLSPLGKLVWQDNH